MKVKKEKEKDCVEAKRENETNPFSMASPA